MQILVELFHISVLDVTTTTIRLLLQQFELQTRGVRAADALHVASAIAFDADLLISTDDQMLRLDGMLTNIRERKIICVDTHLAAKHLLEP